MVSLDDAARFIAAHARLIDRRRFACVAGDGTAEAVVRALDAYRNDDGGIGHLEPDLRTPASQPSCALYALQILHETGAEAPALVAGALDWLQTVTGRDGGVPFVLASARGWPHAPWWQPADDPPSSMLMTAGIAAAALRLGLDDPWLAGAAEYAWAHCDLAMDADAYTLRSLVDFLDATPDRARADAALDRLADRMPADGLLRVGAGTEGELLRPLDLAPWPDHAARRLFTDERVDSELDRLEAEQQDDGGWMFTWLAWNPAVAWEWRGAVTVQALWTLRAYGRLGMAAQAASSARAASSPRRTA